MKKLLIILLTFIIASPLLAQKSSKMIEGNGNIITKKRTVEKFSKLYINMLADVNVKIGGMPMIEITADANIESKINATVINGLLTLEVTKGFWLQNSRPKITLSVPFLTELKTYGQQTNIGSISVNGIDVQTFTVDMLYGDIKLSGRANKLEIESSNNGYYQERGTLNTTKLDAKEVNAKIRGSNSAMVFASERLSANLLHDAALTYEGNPTEVKLSGTAKLITANKIAAVNKSTPRPTLINESKESLTYVSLKIQNNSALRRNFIIKGPNPSGKTFSYGFPMNPYAVREEKVPVGTTFYTQSGGIKGKKLVEVTLSDNGKTVKLF